MAKLQVRGRWFVDEDGRRRLLRGVNLGGSSKVPVVPDGRTHLPTDYADHRDVSFVGRPFPLEEADEHYGRLQRWGYTCLRFVITWEAVEHAGPGQYDEEYLDYLRRIVARADDYGLQVFIDPHQDVWSRMTGGDGAPGWTLEAAGFDVSRLDVSEAAFTHAGRQAGGYRQMGWPGNARRLAAGTMFALLWAGDRLAPSCTVEGEPIQRFLQRHYLGMLCTVAERLTGLDHLLGFGTGNEPSAGLGGVADLSQPLPSMTGGPLLTGLQTLTIPAGFSATVPLAGRGEHVPDNAEHVVLNPDGVSAWQDAECDVWRREGVWDVDDQGRPRLLRPHHFADVDVLAEGIAPLAREVAATVRSVLPAAIIFVEGEPGAAPPTGIEAPVVNASHWYDVLTLLLKHYEPTAALTWGSLHLVTGEEEVRRSQTNSIADLVSTSEQALDGAPTLVGEYGLPFDLDQGAAYRSGDFSAHEQALASYHDALDANLVHATLWNYTADNTNAHGDGWNGEDLSIFSRDQQHDPADPDSGGRALRGFCRPIVQAAAGRPVAQSFADGVYRLQVDMDPAVAAPTLVFCPSVQFPDRIGIEVSSGSVSRDGLHLRWSGAAPGLQHLTLTRRAN